MAQDTISPLAYRDGFFQLDLRELTGWLPVLVLAYPLLVWPMAFSAFVFDSQGTGTALSNIEASGSNAINVLYFLAVGGLAILLAGQRLHLGRRMIWTGALLVVAGYLFWSGLSTVWALNTSISARRLILQGLIIVAAVFAGIVDSDPRKLAHRLFWLCVLVIGLNVLWLGVKPPSPIGVEGIYPQKNTLGAALIIMLPILTFAVVTRRGLTRLLALGTIVAALGLLVLSESKTSLGLAVLVPLLVTAAIFGARVLRTTPAVLIGFTLMLSYLSWLVLSQLTGVTSDDLSQLIFGDPTFTGRTFIWAFINEQIANRPVFGYGFNSFWAVGYDSPSFRDAPGFIVSLLQAHNGYLDVRIETGIVGFAMLCVLLVLGMSQASRLARRDPALGFLALCFILTAVLHNLLETSFFRSYSVVWVGFLLGLTLSTPRIAPLQRDLPSTPAEEHDAPPARSALPAAA